jgi:hypothetical protein
MCEFVCTFVSALTRTLGAPNLHTRQNDRAHTNLRTKRARERPQKRAHQLAHGMYECEMVS